MAKTPTRAKPDAPTDDPQVQATRDAAARMQTRYGDTLGMGAVQDTVQPGWDFKLRPTLKGGGGFKATARLTF